MILKNNIFNTIYDFYKWEKVGEKKEFNLSAWITHGHPKNTLYFKGNGLIVALLNMGGYEVFKHISGLTWGAFKTNLAQVGANFQKVARYPDGTFMVRDARGLLRFMMPDLFGGPALISEPINCYNGIVKVGDKVVLSRDLETGQSKFNEGEVVELIRIDPEDGTGQHGYAFKKGNNVITHTGWNSCYPYQNCM